MQDISAARSVSVQHSHNPDMGPANASNSITIFLNNTMPANAS